ncbi:MAG: hypothetical protein ACAI44_22455, partial [Candidatus Sericytochromatia bacterium]
LALLYRLLEISHLLDIGHRFLKNCLTEVKNIPRRRTRRQKITPETIRYGSRRGQISHSDMPNPQDYIRDQNMWEVL